MKHPQSRQVWAYLDGELESQEERKFEQHISLCGQCRNRMDEIRRLSKTMNRVLQSDVPDASPAFHANLVAALRSSQAATSTSVRRRQKGNWSKVTAYGLGSAAAVCVAAGLGWYAMDRGHGDAVGVSGGVAVKPEMSQTTPSSSTGVLGVGGKPSQTASKAASQIGSNVNGTAIQRTGTNTGTTASFAIQSPKTLVGQTTIRVQSPSGTPISGAHVAFVSDGRLLGSTVTNSLGQTRPMQLEVAADPVLTPVFSEPGFSTQGVMTVVVWKHGYQPLVSYDVRVFEGGLNRFSQSLTISPSSGNNQAPAMAGYGYKQGTRTYHLLTLSAFANWVESTVGRDGTTTWSVYPSLGQGTQPVSSDLSSNHLAADGQIAVQVLDQNGRPVSGARVAVVAGNHVSGSAVTNGTGESPLLATKGIADWRFVGPWNIGNMSPKTAAVVVWKSGFAPAVGMYVPLSSANPTTVHVKLESLAWRKRMGWTNLGAPSAITPERSPSSAIAAAYLSWVSGQGN
ncbi:zf-HC2 domain-containing protein [Alicyclobacillus curvatus]|jgi:hypothetical protein|nr:zf-HC2 domain-containing protein [Alicyclobacillus curvatus]